MLKYLKILGGSWGWDWFVVGFVSERCCCSGRCYSIDRIWFPPVVILTLCGWPSSCSTRVTTLNFGYVTRGLGLLFGCFFALLFPFSGIDDCGDVWFWTRIAFLWLISSIFLERAVEVLDEWTRWCAVQWDRCLGVISYNLELLSLVSILID